MITPEKIAIGAYSIRARLGNSIILKGIDLELAAGQWTSIVGPNGAGKSTLLKCLAGVLVHSGRVMLLGHDLHHLAHRERARQLAWLARTKPLPMI